MGLYDAMHTILVDEGPLDNLFLDRLPPKQTADVETAFVQLSGTGAERAFGKQNVIGAPEGVTHDGGVLWWHSGVQFQVRGHDPDAPGPVAVAADAIRDVLAQYAGEEIVKNGEKIVRCEVSNPPAYYGQDRRGRSIRALTVEVWHRPDYVAAALRAFTPGFSGGFN